MADPVILDCLTLFGPVPPRSAASGTESLTDLMTRHGVAGAITVSTRALFHNSPAGNRETIHFCEQAGPALQPAAVLDPRLPSDMQSTSGARLLCLMPSSQRWPLLFAPLTDLLGNLVKAGSSVPILCEVAPLGAATQLRQITDSVKLTSPVLLGGIDSQSLIEAIAVARSSENYFLVTNGLRGVGEIAMAVAAIGAERVIFGSEAPIRSVGAALALVQRAGLSADEMELVLGGNAKRLLASGGAAS